MAKNVKIAVLKRLLMEDIVNEYAPAGIEPCPAVRR
jgi:hypothetical protein